MGHRVVPPVCQRIHTGGWMAAPLYVICFFGSAATVCGKRESHPQAATTTTTTTPRAAHFCLCTGALSVKSSVYLAGR